jgi:hypothetical protein
MATKKAKTQEKLDIVSNVPATSEFVFMDKALKVLEIGFNTGKNVILYGPGGFGKSDLSQAFLNERGIEPFVITMGTGMTTDRLFGGLDIPVFNTTGKIEYLVENSFMNHEYVIFEELFDAPDFILEQLKDILSSGVFRNGTQTYPIKTKFIICATNRTREEFSKNMSLQALMERFPLENNVIWDNYTQIAYNTLLEKKFGTGNVDPIIPFILESYAKASSPISPRVAAVAYNIFLEAGVDGLMFIADFAKKPKVLKDAVKEYQDNIEVNTIMASVAELRMSVEENDLSTPELVTDAREALQEIKEIQTKLDTVTVSDSFINKLSEVKKGLSEFVKVQNKRIMVATSVID